MFLVVVDYASIVMFFVVLAGLLFLMFRRKPAKAETKGQAQPAVKPSAQVYTITYGLLAALIVLLLAVAWLSERGSSTANSRK